MHFLLPVPLLWQVGQYNGVYKGLGLIYITKTGLELFFASVNPLWSRFLIRGWGGCRPFPLVLLTSHTIHSQPTLQHSRSLIPFEGISSCQWDKEQGHHSNQSQRDYSFILSLRKCLYNRIHNAATPAHLEPVLEKCETISATKLERKPGQETYDSVLFDTFWQTPTSFILFHRFTYCIYVFRNTVFFFF